MSLKLGLMLLHSVLILYHFKPLLLPFVLLRLISSGSNFINNNYSLYLTFSYIYFLIIINFILNNVCKVMTLSYISFFRGKVSLFITFVLKIDIHKYIHYIKNSNIPFVYRNSMSLVYIMDLAVQF